MILDKEKLGKIFIWIGVLAWVPFFILIISHKDRSIFPYLTVHLTGVIFGTRLRASTKKHNENQIRHRRHIIGRILILLGVLAWLPYFYQKYILSDLVTIEPYLIVHLVGVLGGIVLLLSIQVKRFILKLAYGQEDKY
jgi:hypothetical protein